MRIRLMMVKQILKGLPMLIHSQKEKLILKAISMRFLMLTD
jgi:hypothetical protein